MNGLEKKYNLVIVGAGLSGSVIAERASKELGLKVGISLCFICQQFLRVACGVQMVIKSDVSSGHGWAEKFWPPGCNRSVQFLHNHEIIRPPLLLGRIPEIWSNSESDGLMVNIWATVQSLVIDKREHIGGNCYDYIDEHGIRTSLYGVHIFHTKYDRVKNYVQQFSEWIPYEHRVVAKAHDTQVTRTR